MFNDAIKSIIFDLGGVLTEVDPARGARLWHRRTGLAEASFERIFMSGRLKDGFNTGEVTESDFFNTVRRRSGILANDDLIREVWEELLRPMEQTASVARRLKRGYSLAVLSDTDPIHARLCMDGFGLADLFQVKIFSCEHGVTKPDARLYNLAARGLGRRTRSCLFIDDRSGNVEGARAVGMSAHRFVGFEDLLSALRDLGVRVD